MAKRLTEEMVIARTKISDLSKIKRLNCWGSELVDVSLLRKMPSVEVLSLSINKINSLEDFQFCKRLEELYIRQNDIRDLNQICYLQGLTNLKNLWMGENPCANIDGYRLAVLKALPQLQKLDNVVVTTEELKEAYKKGKVLTHPEDPEPSEEEVVEYTPPPQQQQQQQQQQYRYQEYHEQPEYSSPQRSPSRHEPEYEAEEADDHVAEVKHEDHSLSNVNDELSRREQPRRNYSPEQDYGERRRNSYERESPPQQQYYDRSPINNHHLDECNPPEIYKESRIITSQSSNSIKECTNGDRYTQQQVYRHVENEYVQDNAPQRRERHTCSASLRPPFTRRPVTRNSNILSAVLCLVKELDYPSLEVVEMAVRCRMDELDE